MTENKNQGSPRAGTELHQVRVPATRNLTGWRLGVYWLVIAPRQWQRHDNIKGKPGWVLEVRQPNGGVTSIPARTKLGAWWRLLANKTGWGYLL